MDEVQVGLNRGNVFTVKTLWGATYWPQGKQLQDDNNT